MLVYLRTALDTRWRASELALRANPHEQPCHVIGGGLAGCEAALQLASRGIKVVLYEMRPDVPTPAHTTGNLAELVCSNSLKSETMPSGQALLKEELRLLGCFLLQVAEEARVPGGRALVVDRDRFSHLVTSLLESNPNVELRRHEVTDFGGVGRPIILATGPLTSALLSSSLEKEFGRQRLFFYDAISPIIDAESIDYSDLFKADRYGDGGGDYWNIPLDEGTYRTLVRDLREGDPAVERDWERIEFFESCVPIEELARRGDDTLAFGPFRPVGLRPPEGGRPCAVIQLRLEDVGGTSFNLVGCQTRLSQPAQREIFRKLPGLKAARFLRYGQLHRNTYLDSPRLLTVDLALRFDPKVRVAGQLCGTEGYMESIGTGLLAALFFCFERSGSEIEPLPRETMLGSLCRYVSEPGTGPFQPMNANFGLLPAAPVGVRGRKARRAWHCQRSLERLAEWRDGVMG